MRTRDVIILLIVPVAIFTWLYFLIKGPSYDQPARYLEKLKAGRYVSLVFLGDSITFGYGESDNYVYRFRKRLKGSQYFDRTRVYNAGVVGDTAAGGLARLDSTVLIYKPDLVYVAFGGNDLKNRIPVGDFKRDLTSIVRKLQEQGCDVMVMTMPVFNIPLAGKVCKPYNRAIQEVSKETGAGLVDVNLAYRKEIGWFGDAGKFMQADNIHPNSEGHRIIASQINQSLGL